MFGNIFNDLMQQAKDYAEKMKIELQNTRVTYNEKGINITADGNGRILDLEIDPDLLNEDKEYLEDLLVNALNRIVQDVEELKKNYSEKAITDQYFNFGDKMSF